MLSNLDCYFGRDSVVVCGYGLVCVRCISVGVVEALYEPPKFGMTCVECDGLKKLFPSGLLFV